MLRLRGLSWLDWLDFLLVVVVFFLIVTALQRAQATFMLRGVAVIGLILLIVVLLLPLPTFSLLVRGILLFLLIALPLVFQRQVRSFLEDVGRSIGVMRFNRTQEPEELVQPLVRAMEQMSEGHVGALIVLEGEINLDSIAQSGVPVGGDLSSELLRSLFFPKNPLHDGAVLVREQRIVAASCVLPVSRRELNAVRRLGTRHRAAVGMSERSDALVLVVSEETGTVSAAEAGRLEVLEDDTALRERIMNFAQGRTNSRRQRTGLSAVFKPGTRRLRSRFARRARSVVGRLALAVLFALAAWGYVLITTRSLPDTEVNDVRLEAVGMPEGMTVANELPEAVNLVVRTAQGLQAGLDNETFTATLPLSGLEAGLHQVQVEIEPRANMPVHVIDIRPEVVDVNLAPVGRREVTVTLALEEESQLPAAYEVQNDPVISPTTVLVEGPQALVERVAAVHVTLPLTDTQGVVEDVQPARAVDEEGNEIPEVVMTPAEVEVRVTVGRRPDVREVGVAVITEGTPADGFWVSGLSSDPESVILSGPPEVLSSIDSVVRTTPVAIDGAAGNVVMQASLDLPPEVTARAPDGEELAVVQVQVRVSARRGSMTLMRPVELMADDEAELSLQPERVELLLSGPLPVLQEIEARPELVRVVLRVEDEEVAPGESVELALQVIAPAGVNVQLVTPTATVTR